MFKYVTLTFCMFTTAFAYAQKLPAAKQNADGKILAEKCIECHAGNQAALAGTLQGIKKIRTASYIYSLMKNPMRFAEQNKTAKKVFAKRGLQMPPFSSLSKADIKAILDYFDNIANQKN